MSAPSPSVAPLPAPIPPQHLDFLSDPDAIEQRPLGGVTRGVLGLLSAMLIALVLWATFAQLDESVTSRGRLVSSQRNLVVQPLETSIIQSIDVRPGQVVRKGQRLAALDPTFTQADETALKGGISSLDARARRLEGELGQVPGATAADPRNDKLQQALKSTREAHYRARLTAQDENLARLNASLLTNRQDQRLLGERVQSLAEVEQMQERLVSQNYGARRQLLEARDRRQEVERDFQLARNREQEIQREIAAAQSERVAFQNDWRQKTIEELAQVRRERDGTSEQLQKAERRRSLINLSAPVDAIVLETPQRSVGSIVREAETLFTLVPLDVPLEVELQIDASDVGFVKPGDKVRIKLDAFPFQKYGTLEGRIQVVSQDAFSRDPNVGAQHSGTHYYLARIGLDTARLSKAAEDLRLIPGITLSGEILIGRRSVISYFLYPVIGTLDEALKERR